MFEAIGRIFTSFNGLFEVNEATLSGAVDVIVVRQPDGSLKSTPFHVRFGKLQVLHSKAKDVSIVVNGGLAPFKMKLGEAGEAFFEDINPEKYYFTQPPKAFLPEAEGAGEETQAIEFSLAGELIRQGMSEVEISVAFASRRLNYEDFATNPSILENPNLVIRYEGQITPWKDASSKVVSKLAFQGKSSSPGIKPASPTLRIPGQAEERKEPPTATLSKSGRSSDKKYKVKTLRPSSQMLEMLNLQMGTNEISFIVSSSWQGRQVVSSNIYFYDYTQKIIISDVDGTVTKSDVLGHVLPVFGVDWAHTGIAKLFTGLKKQGYEILYLSSRPIGQANRTKNYLWNIDQTGSKLPVGPLIMSPDLMMPSLRREIIFKRPELFKIPALRDIVRTFPDGYNPFVGGFGNRETDAISYRFIGVEIHKIFVINPKSEIHQYSNPHVLSYDKIHERIDIFFPLAMHTDIKGDQPIKSPEKMENFI